MSLEAVLTIIAILVAPVVALQVQKWLELFREKKGRKLWIFQTLMATRAAPVSPEHVQALNMIDLEFREKRYRNVTIAWKTYLDHLNSYPKDNEKSQPLWLEKRIDLMTSLLLEMGRSLDYEFDAVHIKKGIYTPEAHGLVEGENILIRQGLVRLLYGQAALNMNITGFAVNAPEHQQPAAALQQQIDADRTPQAAIPSKESEDPTP